METVGLATSATKAGQPEDLHGFRPTRAPQRAKKVVPWMFGYGSGHCPAWMGWMAGFGMLLGAVAVLFVLYVARRWVRAYERRSQK